MKIFVCTGFKDGECVFSFSITAYNSQQALKLANDDELIKDMQFDRLVMKEVETWLH